jgi:hypothetical protein
MGLLRRPRAARRRSPSRTGGGRTCTRPPGRRSRRGSRRATRRPPSRCGAGSGRQRRSTQPRSTRSRHDHTQRPAPHPAERPRRVQPRPPGKTTDVSCRRAPISAVAHQLGDHSYTGAIALEGLARSNSLDHEHACTAHPLHYIRAAGRLKDPGLASYIQKSMEIGGISVWPMAVSVAGRLQLVGLLTHLEGEIQRTIVEDSELYGPWIRERPRPGRGRVWGVAEEPWVSKRMSRPVLSRQRLRSESPVLPVSAL